MKKCPECNNLFLDKIEYCPDCKEKLVNEDAPLNIKMHLVIEKEKDNSTWHILSFDNIWEGYFTLKGKINKKTANIRRVFSTLIIIISGLLYYDLAIDMMSAGGNNISSLKIVMVPIIIAIGIYIWIFTSIKIRLQRSYGKSGWSIFTLIDLMIYLFIIYIIYIVC